MPSYTGQEWRDMPTGTRIQHNDYDEVFSIMHYERIDDTNNYQLNGRLSPVGWYEVYTDVSPPEIFYTTSTVLNRRLNLYHDVFVRDSLYDTIMQLTT